MRKKDELFIARYTLARLDLHKTPLQKSRAIGLYQRKRHQKGSIIKQGLSQNYRMLGALRVVTLQGDHEERLVREILQRRSDLQKLSRPVVEEQDIIDVDFAVSLLQIIKVVRK